MPIGSYHVLSTMVIASFPRTASAEAAHVLSRAHPGPEQQPHHDVNRVENSISKYPVTIVHQ